MNTEPQHQIQKDLYKVLSVSQLSTSIFIIRLERKSLKFRAGQHIGVGPAESNYTREYSVYSAESDDYIEILVKEVINGFITPLLKNTKAGDFLQVEEPRGYFSLPLNRKPEDHYLFIATGTGISPFHSFIKSYPDLNYTLFHGIASIDEACEPHSYKKESLYLCSSREQHQKAFNGRVTTLLQTFSLENISRIYLCGNVNMINDAYALLDKRKYSINQIHSEVYF